MLPKPPRSDAEKAAREWEALMVTFSRVRDHADEIARLRRALYLAYLAEGFSEGQALELTKAVPW